MHNSPKFSYKGLTIILSNPSRFDTQQLLSGFAGDLFNEALAPGMNKAQCDIRDLSVTLPLLPNTKCLLLLGQNALSKYLPGKTLNEQRGSPFYVASTPSIASYLPQDAIDPQDFEGDLNSAAQRNLYESPDDGGDFKSRHGKTSRANYRFWLQRDVSKCVRICKFGLQVPAQRGIHIYPNLQVILHVLNETKNKHLFLDIETDCDRNITCVGFGFDLDNIYVVPLLRYDYQRGYENTQRFLQALTVAMRDNITVCHNAMFDLWVLSDKYRIPFGRRIEDTMLMHHRCFPEAEKSLGHCVSLWTDEPYHKDEGVFMPNNTEQELKLWQYNAKDIAATMLVYAALESYAKTIPGLPESFAQVNSMIYPYLVTTLTGMRYDETKRAQMVEENDRLMMQYLRCIKLLTGGLEVLPASNKQCNYYFSELLNYPSQGRSMQTNANKWGEKELQKLKLKFPLNAVIDFMLAFRSVQKETGSLGFTPYKQ